MGKSRDWASDYRESGCEERWEEEFGEDQVLKEGLWKEERFWENSSQMGL